MVKIVCCRSPVPFNPTTSPYPKTGLSRTPSTLAMSRTRALCTVSSARAAFQVNVRITISRIRRNLIYSQSALQSLETHNPQNSAHDDIGWAIAFADHALAFEFEFKIGDGVRGYGVVAANIAASHHP